jgi:TolB-like protein
MNWTKLISELKRRHVVKSTIAYLAISWIVIQIASTILPTFDAPDYILQGLIYVLAIGLILWIGFSWIYDLTATGIQKTDDAEISEESIKLTNQRLNKVIAGSLSVGVLLLLGISFWAGSNWNGHSALPEIKKVAVIPLALSAVTEEEVYFQTGMTQALIDELSKVDQLMVINQRSTKVLSAGFDGNNSLISSVIKGIDYFIDGNITRELNTINVHIVLKSSLDTGPIWEKSYSKDLSEVRVLWANVAADLARQMGIVVKPEDAVLWSGLRPVKPDAYELYLKGKHFMNKSAPADWQRGLVYLQEALDKNPADAYTYAWLAEAYITLAHGPDPPPGVFPKALAASQRAIQLDSTLALGWATLSHYHTYFGKDWAMAEYAFDRANALNPNLAYNHFHRAWYLALFGRMNEAIEEHKLAQELDPFTPEQTAWLGELYRWVGMYDEGIIQTEKASLMEDDQNFALGMLIRGWIFIDQGKLDEGLELLRQCSQINRGWKYVGLGPALLEHGFIKEGKAILSELEEMPKSGFNSLFIGIMYAHLGDFDKSFEAWNYENKHAWFPWIRVLFVPDEIRRDPRFLKIIRDMNLPDPGPLVYKPVS